MRGLERIPQNDDLEYAYQALQERRSVPTCAELALWSQWSRFDPRLAEQLVAHFGRRWRDISPIELHERILEQPWPAALGALFEQVVLFFGLPAGEREFFESWAACVMSAVAPAFGEQFFIGLRAFGGKLMHQDATLAITPYRRWGYLGREILVNKAESKISRPTLTLIPTVARRAALEELVRSRGRLTVQEYVDALGGQVGIRQAERDLAAHPRLKARGKTRSRIYVRSSRGAR